LIIPVAAALMEEDGAFIVLIKPQFEVGKDKVPKSGVIRDRSIHKDAILSITNFFNQIGWYIHGLDYSPITGPKGNIEFLAWAKKEPCANVLASQESIQSLVDKAHSQLLKA
jgi:23S rRNA (cytidine1920-2'-O)/16S rRNA (cytidine1409-2'-O)-methyltransferase